MNKVILMGRLTRDPEVRYSMKDDKMAVARYTLAVNRRYKKDGAQDDNSSSIWLKKQDGDIFLRLPVKSICFGIFSHKDKDYERSLQLILDFNEKNGRKVDIKKAIKSPYKYELKEDKQFDVNAELARYKNGTEYR